ncbi:phytoene/squalene synthase family protein [Pseudorhodoplanes sp.]|uniref:phytoene/squalene synthase family protein n=1 Tax=Pseudorhodoplanes sp. TaxID=1934341 RepID=UPI003919AF19
MPWFSPNARPTRPSDLQICRDRLRGGSRSFHAASLLLPERFRIPASALYAFCREADDLIDTAGKEGGYAVALLRERLNRIYAGAPQNRAADRAFAAVVERYAIPRALPEALLDGFFWDAEGRRYHSIADLEDYAARVAGSVGVMMALLMGQRDPAILGRAAALGIAMQLTNICRDVGEDARAGRVYLPLAWLWRAGIDPDVLIARPVYSRELGGVIRAVLAHADTLYRFAAPGIAALPLSCRPAMHIARILYAEIGREIERQDFDSVSQRAVVSPQGKIAALLRAVPETLSLPRASHAVASPAAQFLLDGLPAGAARHDEAVAWYDIRNRAIWLIDLFERLERRDQVQRAG